MLYIYLIFSSFQSVTENVDKPSNVYFSPQYYLLIIS